MVLRTCVMLTFVLAVATQVGVADNTGATTPAPSVSAAVGTQGGSPSTVDASPRLRYRVAVDQGDWALIKTDQWYVAPEVGDGIQAQLIYKLIKSGYFVVMEREAGAVGQSDTEEQTAANQAANAPAGAAPPPPRQRRVAADYILTPTVIGFTQTSVRRNSFGIGGFGGGILGGLGGDSTRMESTLTLNIRISDAQTSEVIDTETATGKAESKGTGFGAAIGGGGRGGVGGIGISSSQFQNSPAGQAVDRALDDAVGKIVARLSREPWSCLVAAQDKNTNRIIINAGNLAGVAVGMTFDVFEAGQPITDPDTGAIISTGDLTKVGQIRVARVEDKASYCDIVQGATFNVRDIVKVAQ